MKELEIYTRGFENERLIVDDDIYEQIKQYRILVSKNEWGKTIRVNDTGYCATNIMKYILGDFNPYEVNIRMLNGKFFDRRRENIVLEPKLGTKRKFDTAKAYGNKFKGVHYNRKEERYRASVFYVNRPIYLGYYKDPVMAAKVYDAGVIYMFGIENAGFLNFPGDTISLPEESKRKIEVHLEKYHRRESA